MKFVYPLVRSPTWSSGIFVHGSRLVTKEFKNKINSA
jgi:hypothetical protein